MKAPYTFFILALGFTLAVIISCSQESTPEAASDEGTPKLNLGNAEQGLTKQAEDLKTQAQSTIQTTKEDVQSTVNDATSAAQEKAQTLIEQAKGLVSENKLTEAMSALQNLSGIQLSEDQKKMVEGLKTTIQQAMAKKTAGDATTEAQKSLGNLIPKSN